MRELHSVKINYDGKLPPALMGKEPVDRLSVIVTRTRAKYLLGITISQSGGGKYQTISDAEGVEPMSEHSAAIQLRPTLGDSVAHVPY